ncbi:uncharacterized protein LOC117650976 [Thrips palmi]|uniref:Uncharacterized protein LOC117650976 n=1 Tax=Thrips palmi TaxID=161013 RepID=A0A6P8ZYP8_THRPL|nr:uncharacterized protein LOC117650976 [Thrips palmi]
MTDPDAPGPSSRGDTSPDVMPDPQETPRGSNSNSNSSLADSCKGPELQWGLPLFCCSSRREQSDPVGARYAGEGPESPHDAITLPPPPPPPRTPRPRHPPMGWPF